MIGNLSKVISQKAAISTPDLLIFSNTCVSGHVWHSYHAPDTECLSCESRSDLGEIRPDLDTLLAADSVCLRTLSDMPQSGNL